MIFTVVIVYVERPIRSEDKDVICDSVFYKVPVTDQCPVNSDVQQLC